MSDDRHDRVRRRAYELWEQQGGEHGRDQDHWHRASAEIDGAEDVSVAAPDGTTMTMPVETTSDDAKPVRKRAAPKAPAAAGTPAAPPPPASARKVSAVRAPADKAPAGKAPAKPRKPKAK